MDAHTRPTPSVPLQPVDAVEVTILVDNVMDALLASGAGVQRAPLRWESFERAPLLAEHGFAALVTVEQAGQRTTLLFAGTAGPAPAPAHPSPR